MVYKVQLKEETEMIYQTILANFGTDIYIGDSLHDAMEAVKKGGLVSHILLDGKIHASFSPILGWKFY